MEKFLVVYLVGFTGIWKAIPVGFILRTPPFWIGALTVLGASTAVTLLYGFGKRVKVWVIGRIKSGHMTKKRNRAKRLSDHYGAIGFGLFGTLILGPIFTIITGLIITQGGRKLLVWTLIGILVWTPALTTVATVSLDLFFRLTPFQSQGAVITGTLF